MTTETIINQLVTPAPLCVAPEQSLAEVRAALAGGEFHHLPVVSDGKLVGLVSASDILKLGLGKVTDSQPDVDRHLRATDIMQPDLVTVGNRATIAEAAKLLATGGFHALPVVDNDMGLVGLITSTDLINYLLSVKPDPEASPEFMERLQSLERVRDAAEHYLHSGQGVTEHARLQKALDTAGKRLVL